MPKSAVRFFLAATQSILLGSVLTFGVSTWSVLTAQAGPAVTMKDLGGVSRQIPAKNKKATLLVFVAHDCPIANRYAPEIARIAAEYGKKGVQTFVVYTEKELTTAQAKEHAKAYGFTMPLLWDRTHKLSSSMGATVTPEAVLLGPDGKQLYRGRIDNRYLGFGKALPNPSQRDLRDALSAVVSGKPVPRPTTTAIGCFIPEPTR